MADTGIAGRPPEPSRRCGHTGTDFVQNQGGTAMSEETENRPAAGSDSGPDAASQGDATSQGGTSQGDAGSQGDATSQGDAGSQAGATSQREATVVSGVIADEKGVLAEGAVAVEGDHALVVARFADTQSAIAVYDGLLASELQGSLHIDGVLVVKADQDGRLHVQKMTDHSTRTGLKWGIVGGIAAAVFLPATLLAGAVALGTAGAAAGKARNLKRRLDVEKQLAGVITPGTSGILALATATDAPDVRLKMPDAQEVETVPVDDETADAIKEAAKEQEATTPSGT
jgi:uncharacterized membrane protein